MYNHQTTTSPHNILICTCTPPHKSLGTVVHPSLRAQPKWVKFMSAILCNECFILLLSCSYKVLYCKQVTPHKCEKMIHIIGHFACMNKSTGQRKIWIVSFPGSPGTRIYIVRRAWYLSYVSMTSAK